MNRTAVGADWRYYYIRYNMWLKEKRINGKLRVMLRPEKVEYIRIKELHGGQGEGSYFAVGIDGVEYTSGQKLNFPAGTGICFLKSPDGKEYWCDDSIIIAAFCRFLYTYCFKRDGKWPERGFELPLLSREESRKYLQWHLIPHPGEW